MYAVSSPRDLAMACIHRACTFLLIALAAGTARAEVWDDFSAPTIAPAWGAPEVNIVTGVAGTLAFDGTTYPGELAITPAVPNGSQNFFYVMRNDKTLQVGEVLRLKLRVLGVTQGTPGQDWVGVGMMLHKAEDRSSYLLYYALNDTRLVGSAGDSQIFISTWQVNQPLEMFIQRTGVSSFRTGMRANNGAFTEVFTPWSLSLQEPPVGTGFSLMISWDERVGAASGKVILDELGTVANPGFPEVPVQSVAPPTRFGYPGDLIYFDGTRTPWSITQYAWSFPGPPDARTITDQAVGAHVFLTTGTFPVQLTLTMADASTVALQTTATIMNPPASPLPMPMRGYLTSGGNDVNTFGNPSAWETTFIWMEQLGLNTAVSIQEHPYAYFIRIPGYPEANSDVSDSVLNNRRAAFENILLRARNHNIKLYMLTYNIKLPAKFAQTHGLPTSGGLFSEDGADTPLTRAYTKAAAKAFMEAFPDVGLCLTVGEAPVGCVDFVKNTIMAAMAEVSGPPRSLIMRDQALYPDQAFDLTTGLPSESWLMMSKLTEEQFLPGAGFRGRLFTQTMGVRNFYLQSRSSDQLFIGSYKFSQQVCKQLADDHALGLLIASDGTSEWILRESLARYLINPNRPAAEEAAFWAGRIRQQYGVNTPAEGFLRAGEAASSVFPLVRSLLFYRNNNYRAQFGLPLISYLGMPSFPSFQHGGIIWPERESELSWWYPRAARHPFDVLTIREDVYGTYTSAAAQAKSPRNVANVLDQLASTALAELATLNAYFPQTNVTEYRNAVRTIQFAALMAQHYAAKLRAAIAWQQWVAGQITQEQAAVDVPFQLTEALNRYLQAIPLYQATFGSSWYTFLMAAQSKQPPWPPSDQNFHGTVTGGMPELSRIWRVELQEMQERIARGDKTLPYFTDMQTAAPPTYENSATNWEALD